MLMSKILPGLEAGIMISIGGSVFLSCESKPVGALLFAVALFVICKCSYFLYTGKIGYMAYNHKGSDFVEIICTLIGNLIGTVGGGLLVNIALDVSAKAETICLAKLEQSIPSAFIRAIFCGILMFQAVNTYKKDGGIAGILFCVPVFILSGFEHSIANMFYFSLAGLFSLDAALYIALIVLGNTIGGLLFPILDIAIKKVSASKGS